MGRQHHTVEQVIATLRSAEVETSSCVTVEEFCRKQDITERRRLRKAASDLTLAYYVLQLPEGGGTFTAKHDLKN